MSKYRIKPSIFPPKVKPPESLGMNFMGSPVLSVYPVEDNTLAPWNHAKPMPVFPTDKFFRVGEHQYVHDGCFVAPLYIPDSYMELM